MVAWPPSGPTTVLILVVDYISELTIHSLYVHPFYVKHFIYSELGAADCAVGIEGFRNCTIII